MKGTENIWIARVISIKMWWTNCFNLVKKKKLHQNNNNLVTKKTRRREPWRGKNGIHKNEQAEICQVEENIKIKVINIGLLEQHCVGLSITTLGSYK